MSDRETVHIELILNGMIMTLSEREEQCHPKARFWLPWANVYDLDRFCDVNGMQKIPDKKTFGILVASRIIQLRH